MSGTYNANGLALKGVRELKQVVKAVLEDVAQLHSCQLTLCGTPIAELCESFKLANGSWTARLRPCKQQRSLDGFEHAGAFDVECRQDVAAVGDWIASQLPASASVVQACGLELSVWGLAALVPGLQLDSDFPLAASEALEHPWLLTPAEQLELASLVLPAVQEHGDEGKLRLALAVFLGRRVHAWRLEVGGEAILSILDAQAQVADPQLQSVSMSSSACDLLCFFTLWTTLDPAGVTVLRLTGPSSMQAKAEAIQRTWPGLLAVFALFGSPHSYAFQSSAWAMTDLQAGGKPRRSLHSTYADELPPYFVTAPGDASSTSPSSTGPDSPLSPPTHPSPPLTTATAKQPQAWPMHSGMARQTATSTSLGHTALASKKREQGPQQQLPPEHLAPSPGVQKHPGSTTDGTASMQPDKPAHVHSMQLGKPMQQPDKTASVHSMQQALQALGSDNCLLEQPLLQVREALRRVDTVQQDLGSVGGSSKSAAAASKIPGPPAKTCLKPPLPPAARLMSQTAVPARQRTRQYQDRPQPTHAAPASTGRQGAKPEAPDHSQLEGTIAGQAHALQLLQLTETLEAAAEPAEPLSQAPSAAATRPAACTAQPGPGRVDPPICSDFSGKGHASALLPEAAASRTQPSAAAQASSHSRAEELRVSSNPVTQLVSLLYELVGAVTGLVNGSLQLGRLAVRYPLQILQTAERLIRLMFQPEHEMQILAHQLTALIESLPRNAP